MQVIVDKSSKKNQLRKTGVEPVGKWSRYRQNRYMGGQETG